MRLPLEKVFFDSLQTGGFHFAHNDEQYNLVMGMSYGKSNRINYRCNDLSKKMNKDRPIGTD